VHKLAVLHLPQPRVLVVERVPAAEARKAAVAGAGALRCTRLQRVQRT